MRQLPSTCPSHLHPTAPIQTENLQTAPALTTNRSPCCWARHSERCSFHSSSGRTTPDEWPARGYIATCFARRQRQRAPKRPSGTGAAHSVPQQSLCNSSHLCLKRWVFAKRKHLEGMLWNSLYSLSRACMSCADLAAQHLESRACGHRRDASFSYPWVPAGAAADGSSRLSQQLDI